MNIKEIAKEANMSIATVSRVINHPDRVSLATLEKVNRLINKYGYTPNVIARNLKTDSTQTIALLIPNISDSVYKDIVAGVENIITSKKYNVILCNTKSDLEMEKNLVDMAMGRKVEGIIMVDAINEGDITTRLDNAGIPVVYIGKRSASMNENRCYTDFREASAALTKHLMSLKNSSIDLIMPEQPVEVAKQMIEGWRNIKGHAGAVHYCDDSIEAVYSLIEKLTKKNALPDSVITKSEEQAFGIYKAAQDCGIIIPDDLAVCCMTDSPANAILSPPLTSIYVPATRLGMVAARLLFDSIDGISKNEHMPQEISMHSRLIIRKSCGNRKDIYEAFPSPEYQNK